jgi:thiamine pyrophosphokinase
MKKTEGQITQWPNEKDMTDNTMAKRKRQKDRQHNGQTKKTEGQTIQWPKEKDRTDNTMAKRKRQKAR